MPSRNGIVATWLGTDRLIWVTEQKRFRFVAQQAGTPFGAEMRGAEKRDEVTGHMNDVGFYPNACPVVV